MKSSCVLLAVLAAAVGAEDIKDNYVYFQSNGSVVVDFNMTSHSITGGQPWGGVTSQGDSILVKAGRHNSAGVAAAFVDGISVLNVMATNHAYDELPHDLNFAIFGDLKLNFSTGETAVCRGFRIAQGHYTTHNNWWFASTKCEATPTTHKMTCVCDGTSVEFHSESIDDKMYVLPSKP